MFIFFEQLNLSVEDLLVLFKIQSKAKIYWFYNDMFCMSSHFGTNSFYISSS